MNKRVHRRILAECLRMLETNDVKVTDAVAEVIEHFFLTDEHVALQDIEHYAQQQGLVIGSHDIQRAFMLLVDFGFAVTKDFGNGDIRYEHMHVGEHHDHLCCLRCGAIIEFLSPIIEDEQMEVARKHGFHSFSHKMQIHGLCSECFGEAAESLVPLSMVLPGGRFRIVEVGVGHGKMGAWGGQRRLSDMGLAPDVRGQVLQNRRGIVVVLIGGTRIALRAGQGHKIRVAILN